MNFFLHHDIEDIWPFDNVEPVELQCPTKIKTPLVFSFPHSGQYYPPDFINNSCLDAHELRLSEDSYVDELYGDVQSLGALSVKANFPRAFIDVNRGPYELDAKMFASPLPNFVKTNTARVKVGLGTIPKIIAENKFIYSKKLDTEQALKRIGTLYFPYHQNLKKALERVGQNFSHTILIDCHSMPYTPLSETFQNHDIIIGDLYGKSCHPRIRNIIRKFLNTRGYNVGINSPYAGGYINQNYGHPRQHVHSIQIEISRHLYMNEETLEKRPEHFKTLQNDLSALVHFLSQQNWAHLLTHSVAAE